MNNRIELLAPAGNYESFLGAVNAGADAVYLGGDKFGARAYADNFTAEEVCRAIHTAHFMGKKIYLTVNTLVKETEFSDLYEWMLPFYEEGLDGVIVQDMGVLCYIREHFKDLSLHASTQMSLTGTGGALFLKEQGVERIVPARELSLEEVRRIKEVTGLEIECFIHGAMCYCYSGQCLFSSILGGRSGNRGRCAQPCRLPYQIYEGKNPVHGIEYPLSLKDMCTISYIPQLIEAGIDSFKIEGRMKKPEYTAGVTALYRKYIDLYEEKGTMEYSVADKDMKQLHSLYIRSEVQTGYYERHNGREMITLHKPGYEGSDQALLEEIRSRYVRDVDKLPVKMCITLKENETAKLEVTGPQGVSVSVTGDIVQHAMKTPLQKESVQKQLKKTGNSLVIASECEIAMSEDVFMPVSALNELRRKGVEAFEQQYIIAQGMVPFRENAKENDRQKISQQANARLTRSVKKLKNLSDPYSGGITESGRKADVDIVVSTYGQLTEAVQHPCRRIYIDSDLYLSHHEKIHECMGQHSHLEYYLALPYIIRAKDEDYLQKIYEVVTKSVYEKGSDKKYDSDQSDAMIGGFLIRNFEEAAYVRSLGQNFAMVPDAGLYVFNKETINFWKNFGEEYTLPYELNAREAGQLTAYAKGIGMNTILIVYSMIPMMITANCIRKTAEHCTERDKKLWIKDRYGTDFPVETNCTHCYNIIYNSVPYSLHLQTNEVGRTGANIWRYDFTVETAEECRSILAGGAFPYAKYTTGHIKRGVE